MSQYLQTEREINEIDTKYEEDSKKCVILEVDLEYPQELHDLYNDYPLAPEKMKVTKEVLSPSCEEKSSISASVKYINCNIPTLNKKEKYVLHYRNLQLYTYIGLKVKKIDRVLEFNQSL